MASIVGAIYVLQVLTFVIVLMTLLAGMARDTKDCGCKDAENAPAFAEPETPPVPDAPASGRTRASKGAA